MKAQPELIVVERDALIQALVALERQSEIHTILLSAYVDWLKTLTQRIESVFLDSETVRARHALHDLLLPANELNPIFTDEQLEAWRSEAQTILTRGDNP